MEDELDDKIIYQTYVSHMKLLSRAAWGLHLNASPAHLWRLLRLYALKPEVVFIGTVIFVVFVYLQAADAWSRNLIGRLQCTLGRAGTRTKAQKLSFFRTAEEVEKASWEMKVGPVAAYAVQGRRPRMEDRCV